jgi:hypothetical protein
MSVSTTTSHQPLKLNFKDDTLTTVSPDTVRALAEKLGLNETQTVLYALAKLGFSSISK